MDERVMKLLNNLASEWQLFAYGTGLMRFVVGNNDFSDKCDEEKLELVLKKLIEMNSSNYMELIENYLSTSGKLDILNKLKLMQASDLLKSYYISYGEKHMFEQVYTDLSMNSIELTYINEDDVLACASCEMFDEWDYFVKKHSDVSNTMKAFEEISLAQPQLLLLSGNAGIGKTNFLQKCVFCWAKGLLWKNIDFVLHFNFKKLNKTCHISSAHELINKFYKNILKGQDILGSQMNIMFVLDGLNEFVHLEELYKCISGGSSKLPIISTLMDVFTTTNKCVLGGRVESVMKYHSLFKKHNDILHIQVMGFSNLAIGNYFGSTLLCKTLKDDIAELITSSPVAKALLSVPSYTKGVCSTLSLCFGSSLKTMTELQTLIFLHFIQQINKATEKLYLVIQENKQHILNVCKVAFNMLERGMVKVSKAELATVLDNNGFEPFGLIIKSRLTNEYQFIHLFLMTFCAAVHLYFYKSPQEVLQDDKLCSCLPVVCGLVFGDGRNVVSLITQLQKPVHTEKSWLKETCELVPDASLELKNLLIEKFPSQPPTSKSSSITTFMECFFEAQVSITDELKKPIGELPRTIIIHDRKTAREVSHEKYFMEKFFDAGFKLNVLIVSKNNLSEDEKKLLILCSTNVSCVILKQLLKIDEWTPSQKIEMLVIPNKEIFVSKNEFEDLLLPWIRLADCLDLYLHDDTNFIDDICDWLRGSNFKQFFISYRGKKFYNIEEFKKFN